MTSDSNNPTDEEVTPAGDANGSSAASSSGPVQPRGVLRPRPPQPDPEPPDELDVDDPFDDKAEDDVPALLQPRGAIRPSAGRGRNLSPNPSPTRQPRERALSGDVLPPPIPGYQPYYPQEDEPFHEGLLRNPYVLAGLAVAGAIFLAVIVVFFFGGGDGTGSNNGNGGNDPNVIVDPLTPLPGRGITARSIATATVREGPAAEYLEIGLLRSGQDVEVVGRNADASWFEIYYPPRSQLLGWVPSSALRLPDGAAGGLPVVAVTPIPRPTVIQPTPEPVPTETPTPTPTVTGTPGASGTDVAVSILDNNCQAGQPLIVTVRNAGTTSLQSRELRITVSTPGGGQGIFSYSVSMEPGTSTNLPTTQLIQPPRTSVRIDLIGSPADTNSGNNSVECVVQGGQPAATPTRTPRP